ncbi:hypothetical protein ACIQYF_10795 [Pseudomonas sp. NPDC096917]|uniref:hypothetical protein n=1 Tax=Pseudomonas sp. NPDC096917 TaxID=3364483 RepID=UPI003839E26E
MEFHSIKTTHSLLLGFVTCTGSKTEWKMIDVIPFSQRGSQHVADVGGGVELIWTPAINPTDTLGIPPLKGAPQTSEHTKPADKGRRIEP